MEKTWTLQSQRLSFRHMAEHVGRGTARMSRRNAFVCRVQIVQLTDHTNLTTVCFSWQRGSCNCFTHSFTTSRKSVEQRPAYLTKFRISTIDPQFGTVLMANNKCFLFFLKKSKAGVWETWVRTVSQQLIICPRPPYVSLHSVKTSLFYGPIFGALTERAEKRGWMLEQPSLLLLS